MTTAIALFRGTGSNIGPVVSSSGQSGNDALAARSRAILNGGASVVACGAATAIRHAASPHSDLQQVRFVFAPSPARIRRTLSRPPGLSTGPEDAKLPDGPHLHPEHRTGRRQMLQSLFLATTSGYLTGEYGLPSGDRSECTQ